MLRTFALPALLFVTAIAAFACDRAPSTSPDPAGDQDAKEVTLVPVSMDPLERIVEVTGNIDAFERVTLTAKVPGRIAELPIDLASKVTKGDLVARLEPVDYELDAQQAAAAVEAARAELGLSAGAVVADPDSTAVVREARSNVAKATAALDRARKLEAEGLMSASDLEAAVAASAQAEAGLQRALEEVRLREATIREKASGLAQARQALADTAILSPIDGVVQKRLVDPGEYVAVGMPVAEIVRVDPLRLRVAIPEREAHDIKEGNPVRVQVDGSDTVHEGVIARVAPALDPDSRTLLAEADLKNSDSLRPGSLVNARIVVAQQPAKTAPVSAIVVFAGLSKVLTVVDGAIKEVPVTTGRTAGDRIEILSGVEADTMIVEQPGTLRQGQAVRVRQGG